jgi:DNA polymerase
MIVGEAPGASEDAAGRPFVGRSGALLERGLAEVGIDRASTWITNAVKHFKWRDVRGRRAPAPPAAGEIRACQPWLLAELEVVRPRLVLCLGATAAKALMGPGFKVSADRGRLFETPHGPRLLATLHPAALLRSPDREAAYAAWLDDLRKARAALDA